MMKLVYFIFLASFTSSFHAYALDEEDGRFPGDRVDLEPRSDLSGSAKDQKGNQVRLKANRKSIYLGVTIPLQQIDPPIERSPRTCTLAECAEE